MPAPAEATYSLATIIAAHTAVLGEIDGAASTGNLILYDESDTVLATIPLTDPAGTVSGATGQLTITPSSTATAGASGTCSWGAIKDSDGNTIVSLPAKAGSSADSGFIVLNSLVIVSGAVVTASSITVG